MKLLIGVASVAISVMFVATASAKPEDSSRRVSKLDQVEIVSMIDDIAVPIHVSMNIQSDNQGYAVIAAKSLHTGGETAYRLRISRDTNNSSDNKYLIYDNDWEAVREFSVPTQKSSVQSSANDEREEDDDEQPDDDQQDTTDQENDDERSTRNQTNDSSPSRPEPVEGIEDDDESQPEDDDSDDESVDDATNNEDVDEDDEQASISESLN